MAAADGREQVARRQVGRRLVGHRPAQVADVVDGHGQVAPADRADRVRRRGGAVDEDRVVVALDRRAHVRAPLAAHAVRRVVDVAQAEDDAAARGAAQRLERLGQLTPGAERELVHDGDVGVEARRDRELDPGAHRVQPGDVQGEPAGPALAVLVAGPAGQLEDVHAGRHAEPRDDRRAGDDERARLRLDLRQAVGDRQGAAQVAEADELVRKEEEPAAATLPRGHVRQGGRGAQNALLRSVPRVVGAGHRWAEKVFWRGVTTNSCKFFTAVIALFIGDHAGQPRS